MALTLTRRDLLRAGALGLVASSCLRVYTDPEASSDAPLLVVVFLRGGADGLHLVAPVGDPDYERMRGPLALRETIPLTPEFGLHPALAPLAPVVERGQLAVIHAAGSPNPTRSHFRAQDLMDLGSAVPTRERLGWLARALGGRAAPDFSALSLGPRVPLSMRGIEAFALTDPALFGLPSAHADERRALERAYARKGSDPALLAGRKGLASIRELRRAAESPAYASVERRATTRLAERAETLLALDASGIGVRAAVLEAEGGWDSHTSQGADVGGISRSIHQLGLGLGRLLELAGDEREVLVVVKTEFGRTVRPNGAGGTDHGRGSVMLVAGQRVRGGVYGEWPGLCPDRLFEGRDLPVTTDYRDVLYELLSAHLGSAPRSDVFPDFEPRPLGILA